MKTKHIFAGGMRIAQVAGGKRHYHHKDHLGSTIGVTDDTGWLVWASDYEPYGLPRSTWQKYAGLDSLIRHRYTDQEYDDETKLYNYNARLYDPSIARFISPDTIVESPYSSIGLNRYMYVAGNPLRYTDPTGHWKIGKFLNRAIGSTTSKVMDDWMGIEYASAGYFNVVGVEVGFDFRNNGVEMSAGVGVGEGGYFSVSTASFDMSGGHGYWATVGYDTRNGAYVSASYNGASAHYYLSSGYYSVGYGMSFGVVGVSAGYSNAGGWSLGGRLGAVGATYSYGAKSWRYSINPTDPSIIGQDKTGDANVQSLGADMSGVTYREGGLLIGALQSFGFVGITLGDTIIGRNGMALTTDFAGFMSHELVHVGQWNSNGYGSFAAKYIAESIRHGYEQNRFEREARDKSGYPY